MSFKTIELMGFKSFADKLEIKFGPGVTAIVGPNGCGKSNVADAVRWVLGEQSAKTLRGGSMQDVIFNGTQMRKSLSYCEVSLIFDNTDKMLDLEYDEVVFTRKLYRSNESEYLINRRPCRLKDIVTLLHSVGLGKDGYSIIGQNKISEIMNSKPLDRRSIFEEATGIAGFKAKKNETERKLAAAADNLARYNDIMQEVAKRLAPLKAQAESAREYFSLAEQLKSHEINTYLYKYENAERLKERINQKLTGITEESENKKEQLTKTQKEYETAFSRQRSMDSTLFETQDKLREKEVYIEKQQGAGRVYIEKISALNSDIQRNTEHIASGEGRLKEIEKESISKQNDIDQTEKELKQLDRELSSAAEEAGGVNAQIRAFEEAAAQSHEKIINSLENLADIRSSAGSLSAERQALLQRKEEYSQKASGLEEKYTRANTAAAEVSGKQQAETQAQQALKEEYVKLTEQLKAANIEVAECDNRLYMENSAYSTLEANHRMLLSLKESYGGYIYSVKNLMNAAASNDALAAKIKGVIADIIKTEQEYETAIETAIGGAMQNIVTDSADDARDIIEYLKRTKGGTVTFLPVRSVKPRFESPSLKTALNERGSVGTATSLVKYGSYYSNIAAFLLGNTLICDNIANAVAIAKKYSYAFKIVTLEGDIINPSGSVTGGYKKPESVNLLANERKLAETEKDMEKSAAALKECKQKKTDLEQERAKLTANINKINENHNICAQNLIGLKTRLESLLQAAEDSGAELDAVYKTLDAISIRLNKIEREESAASEGKLKAELEKDTANLRIESDKREFEGLKERGDRLNAQLSDIKLTINTLGMKKSALFADIARLQTEKEQSVKLIEAFERENAQKTVTVAELKTAAEKSALSEEEFEKVKTARQTVIKLSAEKDELSGLITALDNKKDALTAEITRLNEKKYNEELALARIDSELDAMRERIWEEYQATYENSLSLKIENYDAQAGKSEIARIKRKITALGSINYNAIEDYNEQSARYEEMQSQKADLEKAHADLTAVLKELKNEMQKQFDEGFDKINENFRRTFKELFGGGRAQLQMDYSECEDPLEAGVEIVAEPPGKKLQKISLLSGGEQALTAIAILFAILKLRAMPFCVLDEIEAALDEANVDRFARYLKTFSEKTQFIVITHRKPTMELADALYGVTMEEKGVSRIVSVKLSDIENQLEIA